MFVQKTLAFNVDEIDSLIIKACFDAFKFWLYFPIRSYLQFGLLLRINNAVDSTKVALLSKIISEGFSVSIEKNVYEINR